MAVIEVTKPNQMIRLGWTGEQNVTEVLFDISSFVQSFGDSLEPQILVKRTKDEYPNIANCTREGNKVRWNLSPEELSVAGNGDVQLVFYADGDVIAKSDIYHFYVKKALGDNADGSCHNPPWYESIRKDVEDAKDAANRAHESANKSANSANNASVSENNAGNHAKKACDCATEALKSKESSEESANKAAGSANEAKDAIAHPPVIRAGTWWLYDLDSKRYVNTAVRAKGTDGYSPSVKIEQNSRGAIITVIDKDGSTAATIWNGTNGSDGGYYTITAKIVDNILTFDFAPSKEGMVKIPSQTVTLPEGADVTPEQIAKAVEDYFVKNPINFPVTSVNNKTGAVNITAKDLGALTQDALQGAINIALKQAKDSGEFNGQNGYSPSARVDTTPDGAKITVTDQTGQTVVVVKNGRDGDNAVVDSTLTESGKAADSKVVGDKFTTINESLADYIKSADLPAATSEQTEEVGYNGETKKLMVKSGRNGKDAPTPAISIGKVETLAPMEQATAELTGPITNLLLNLGIPQGKDGAGGGGETRVVEETVLAEGTIQTSPKWGSTDVGITLKELRKWKVFGVIASAKVVKLWGVMLGDSRATYSQTNNARFIFEWADTKKTALRVIAAGGGAYMGLPFVTNAAVQEQDMSLRSGLQYIEVPDGDSAPVKMYIFEEVVPEDAANYVFKGIVK